mmetsp:Transcript_53255/g.121388  ORF Transcript_53255/g.121388 Transcript_53255/m.121388 type:complete len:157 (+) Transcript_53255:805-1275(+)
MKWALRIMPDFLEIEALQNHALGLLAQLSDNYAMRRELFRVDWVSPTVAAVNGNVENTTETWLDKGGGKREKRVSREPSRHAVDTCAWACKLFAQMACDNAKRVVVADDALPVVINCMKFCPEEPTVNLNACKAIYNCVYRCEAAHIMATEEDALG